jgi:hypothetical protein
LRQHLRPVPAPDPKRLARLIADLDDLAFAVRERATRELGELGRLARPALRQVLTGQPSPEVRRRVERLLERPDEVTLAADDLQAWRAITVLEHLGTAEARQVLKKLAEGVPEARPTEGANAALQRLAKRPAVTP